MYALGQLCWLLSLLSLGSIEIAEFNLVPSWSNFGTTDPTKSWPNRIVVFPVFSLLLLTATYILSSPLRRDLIYAQSLYAYSSLMFRRAAILLSLCFAILCAFVGYLSYQATQEAEKIETVQEMTSCDKVIESPPVEFSPVVLGNYRIGKRIVHLDLDDDGQWDQICVPFFPEKQEIKYGYRAVLVCFEDVADEAAFREIATQGEFETTYWPTRQKVDPYFHAQLAEQYRHLDFANSPILHYGFASANPLLGEASLKGSIIAGGLAVLAAFLVLLSGLFKLRRPKKRDDNEGVDHRKTSNRAGLPIS